MKVEIDTFGEVPLHTIFVSTCMLCHLLCIERTCILFYVSHCGHFDPICGVLLL